MEIDPAPLNGFCARGLTRVHNKGENVESQSPDISSCLYVGGGAVVVLLYQIHVQVVRVSGKISIFVKRHGDTWRDIGKIKTLQL